MASSWHSFHTKDGKLNAYAFSCGYVQEEEAEDGARVTLYREHGIYHVRGFNRTGLHQWDTTTNLSHAQGIFESFLK